jgi:hypothetical protein
LARLEYGYVLSPVGILSAPETSYGEDPQPISRLQILVPVTDRRQWFWPV